METNYINYHNISIIAKLINNQTLNRKQVRDILNSNYSIMQYHSGNSGRVHIFQLMRKHVSKMDDYSILQCLRLIRIKAFSEIGIMFRILKDRMNEKMTIAILDGLMFRLYDNDRKLDQLINEYNLMTPKVREILNIKYD